MSLKQKKYVLKCPGTHRTPALARNVDGRDAVDTGALQDGCVADVAHHHLDPRVEHLVLLIPTVV